MCTYCQASRAREGANGVSQMKGQVNHEVHTGETRFMLEIETPGASWRHASLLNIIVSIALAHPYTLNDNVR